MARPPRALLALLAPLALAACSLDYGQAGGREGAPEPPTASFSDYQHTIVVRGAKSFELRAAKAEAYDAEKRTELYGVAFAEYDPDSGELVSQGRADRATFWAETEDAELSGSVRLESKRQDAVLEGEYLKWDGKAKRLEGRLDHVVRVSRSDGSRVVGAGFEADARRRSFSFRESVEGVVADPDKAER